MYGSQLKKKNSRHYTIKSHTYYCILILLIKGENSDTVQFCIIEDIGSRDPTISISGFEWTCPAMHSTTDDIAAFIFLVFFRISNIVCKF